jgi:delta(3,5)-delta(2,4)-dienoyl-CoA isomerase
LDQHQNYIAMAENDYQSLKYFIVRFPAEQQYVAHVEINRPDKMNAFFEA